MTFAELIIGKLSGQLRRWVPIVNNIQESQTLESIRISTLALHQVRGAVAERYGRFPIAGTWVRSEGGFGPRYVYKLKDVELFAKDGTVCVSRHLAVESVGNAVNAACRAIVYRMFRPFICSHMLPSDNAFVFLPCVGYFHFIMESLAALLYALKYYPSATVLVDEMNAGNFIKEYLDILKEKGIVKNIRSIHSGTVIKVPKYIFCAKEPDSGMFCTDTVRILQHALGSIKTAHRMGKRKLFITRRGNRQFTNQDLLEETADHCGYEVIDTATMRVKSEIELFADASVVVANHGAGLTNMIYARPGTKVLELFSSAWLNDSYFRLASICGHKYDCLVADKDDGWGSVDIELFERKLKELEQAK